MLYITGDCHADWRKFSSRSFPEQKDMTSDDFVIVCGDFGIWHDTKEERYDLDWLEKKNFTICFVDGNHENFDRLYSNEFPVVDFNGGKAHKIRENIYHLMRGYIFNICGKKIFTFGGASSHDIQDGILNPDDYKDRSSLFKDFRQRTQSGKMVRINHISWWKQELPTQDEMSLGKENLKNNNNSVDYIISHCAPTHIIDLISSGIYESDQLTEYFEDISKTVSFKNWFFGHYHEDMVVDNKFTLLFDQIVRVI